MVRTEQREEVLPPRAIELLRGSRAAGTTPPEGAPEAVVVPGRGWIPAAPVPPVVPVVVPDPSAVRSDPPGRWRRAHLGHYLGRHRPIAPRALVLPAGLRHAEVRARGGAIAGLLVLALVVGVVFALRVSAAQRAAEPVPVAPRGTGIVARSVPTAFATDGGGPASTVGAEVAATAGGPVRQVVVHVVGEVTRPGVVRVPEGARVVDAVLAAGGPLPGADIERVNLARVVGDGEQVHVPEPGEPLLPGTGVAAGSPGAGPVRGAGPVNLNTADAGTLDTLPGVGPVLAQRILDWRAEHGRFSSVDELGEVSGIGDKLLAQLTPKVTV